MNKWSKNETMCLKELWTVQGMSMGQIARVMKKTRNAIAGRVNRLGLVGKGANPQSQRR